MIDLIIDEEYGYKYYKCIAPSIEEIKEWWLNFDSPDDFYMKGCSEIPQLKEWQIHEVNNIWFDNLKQYENVCHIHENCDSYLKLGEETLDYIKP